MTGSSVYSPNQTIFYVDLNAMVEVCKPGQDCAKYSWINTDTAGLMSKYGNTINYVNSESSHFAR